MKLKTIISTMLILLLVITSGSAYYLYQSWNTSILNETVKYSDTSIDQLALETSSHLEFHGKPISTMASLPEIKKAFTRPTKSNLENANQILDIFCKTQGALTCYLMDKSGLTIASSNRNTSKSFVGKNYGFRPYFAEAIKGSPYVYLALGVTSKKRGIYFSHPVMSNNKVLGVAVIKLSVKPVEKILSRMPGIATLTSPDGVVFASNLQFWLFKTLWKLTPEQSKQLAKNRQYADANIESIELSVHDEQQVIDTKGNLYIHSSSDIKALPGWNLHYFHKTRNINDTVNLDSRSYIVNTLAIILISLTLFALFLFREANKEIKFRKATEQELYQFKSTLDATLDCVFMFTPDTLKFIYVNDGAIKQVGYTHDELMQMTPFDIKPEISEAEFRNLIQPLLDEKLPAINFETVHQHKDGHLIPVEIFLQYISTDKDKRFVALVRDITERRRIDKLKNEFVSVVSHELRTPLTSINGSLSLLMQGNIDKSSINSSELIEIASRNSERLLFLINDILDIQKIEAGKLEFKYQDFELNEFVTQAVEDSQPYVKQHDIIVVVNTPAEPVTINSDKERLLQVMNNLISNAAKFSESGSEIEITAEKINQRHIRISVKDHGIGLTSEQKIKIFEKFMQVDSSDTRQKGGTGLGLAITKLIIEKLGGTLDVDSTIGEGSVFFFELPYNS